MPYGIVDIKRVRGGLMPSTTVTSNAVGAAAWTCLLLLLLLLRGVQQCVQVG